jgi:hypothetical protein
MATSLCASFPISISWFDPEMCWRGSIRIGRVGVYIKAAAYAGGGTRLSQIRIRVHIRGSAPTIERRSPGDFG